MTSKGLKIALVASVAVNLFAAAAGASLYFSQQRIEKRVEEQHRTGRGHAFWAAVDALDPEVGGQVRGRLRAAALEARPDFEEARNARQEAIRLAGEPTMDPAVVKAVLEQSRAAEFRGRVRLENNAVDILTDLSPDNRRELSPLLSRYGPRDKRDYKPDRKPDHGEKDGSSRPTDRDQTQPVPAG